MDTQLLSAYKHISGRTERLFYKPRRSPALESSVTLATIDNIVPREAAWSGREQLSVFSVRCYRLQQEAKANNESSSLGISKRVGLGLVCRENVCITSSRYTFRLVC